MKASEGFQLPKEFEGFVSNADSLLQQFQRLEVEDAVTMIIHLDQDSQYATSVSDALLLLDKLTASIEEISNSFIWFKDSLKLSLIIPTEKNAPLFFRGVVKFGDSIEDEWFISYIALKISQNVPISISLTDSDGEFILIEAAEFIPDWIDPENCENRVWIRNGKVHIISIEEAGRNIKDCGINLKAALETLQSRPRDTIASRKIQEAIEQVLSRMMILNVYNCMCRYFCKLSLLFYFCNFNAL
jgi:hypothetical protein